MRPLAFLTALALAIAAPLAGAQLIKQPDQKIDNDDAAAMKQLAQDNLNEIEAGKMAAGKASSPAVKQFGQRMLNDHEAMLADLKNLARAKGVALPDKAAIKDLAQLKQMEKKSGADFDRTFMDHMVKDHDKAVKEANQTAAKAKDPDFKAAAQRASYKIQEHLALAKQVASGQGAATGATRSWPVTPSPTTPSTPSGAGEINPRINYSK